MALKAALKKKMLKAFNGSNFFTVLTIQTLGIKFAEVQEVEKSTGMVFNSNKERGLAWFQDTEGEIINFEELEKHFK